MLPVGPSALTTRLGVFRNGVGLTLLVAGRAVPVGQTVTYDGAVGSMAVTVRATALTLPSAGMPGRPAIWTSSVLSGHIGPDDSSAVRVSTTRWGSSGTKPLVVVK